MTYSWTFKNLLVASKQGDLTEAVVSIDYRIGYTADRTRWVYHYGSVAFAPADPTAFTPFADITEDDMISFVTQTLGAGLDTIKADLQTQFDNPTEKRDLPWEVALNSSQD